MRIIIDGFEFDTKSSWWDNEQVLSQIMEKYGPEVAEAIVEFAKKIEGFISPERQPQSTETKEVNIGPYWAVFVPSEGLNLPVISTVFDSEEDAIRFVETYKQPLVPVGYILAAVKIVKAVMFV